MVHRSSLAYLSSYLYHQLLPESQKSRKIPSRSRPPGTKTFYLRDKHQSKHRPKRCEPCLYIGEEEYMVHISSSAYLSSYSYHHFLPESQKSRRPRTLGSITTPLRTKNHVQTSVQTLESFTGYIQRRRYDLTLMVVVTWYELYITRSPRNSKIFQMIRTFCIPLQTVVTLP